MSRNFNLKSLNRNRKNASSWDTLKKLLGIPSTSDPKARSLLQTIGYTFYLRSEGKIFVAKNGSFLEKEFLSKGVSGRKVELDEVLGIPSTLDPKARSLLPRTDPFWKKSFSRKE